MLQSAEKFCALVTKTTDFNKALVPLVDVNGRHSTPLHVAAGFGRVECVERLIAAGADFCKRDDSGLQPLHNACSFGHVDVVRILIERGAPVTTPDNWGFTPLHEAAAKDKADVCVLLLQYGASPYAENSDSKTPIELARGDAKAVFTGDYRKEDLLEAARNGCESTVSRLLTQFNVSCHADSGRKSTPLHLAAGYNRVGLVELLLSKGADVHAKDKGGLVPLHNACSFGHVEVVKLLLKAGAGVNEEDLWKFTPLHEAISKGRMAVALLLMLHGADYFRKNASGKSPIELAPNEAFRKQLLNDFYGCRIYDAAANCDVSALRNLLTERDANFIHPFKMEYPLHAVARAKHLQRAVIAEMLINKGCPLDRYNNKSMTPLHLAVQNGLLDVARVLLKAWAAVDKLTSDGRTILHIAAANGDIEMCEMALAYGVQVDLKDKNGQTAVDVARSTATGRQLAYDGSGEPSEQNGEQEDSGSADSSNACPKVRRANLPRTREEAELLEAAKSGDLATVLELLDATDNRIINCKDVDGRQSTPLHFAAGYNRIQVTRCLLERGADVKALDTGWLIPLHNACAYGHLAVAELLVEYGSDVNAADRWKYTPLHEAALKGRFKICKLLILNGADPQRKGRDGKTPVDVVKEGAEDVADLLRGEVAILKAAKKGDVEKMRKILTPMTINCRDTAGRNSTPLHLACGYNNIEVARLLLENGAEVNAQDKGGLIPLHNASSYGHLEIAALLIEHGALVDQPDKWGFTPLHEAAQKGRTQICSLLLSHGANVYAETHEGQLAINLTTAADTKQLLKDAMPTSFKHLPNVRIIETADLPATSASKAKIACSNANNVGSDAPSAMPSTCQRSGQMRSPTITSIHTQFAKNVQWANFFSHLQTDAAKSVDCRQSITCELEETSGTSIGQFLATIGLSNLEELFVKEAITVDVLASMSHDDLKSLGVSAFGTRFLLLKNAEKLMRGSAAGCSMGSGLTRAPSGFVGTVLVPLCSWHSEFHSVEEGMNATLVVHNDSTGLGGVYTRFSIVEVQKVLNKKLREKYMRRRADIAEENDGEANEKMLYHGSPFIHSIVEKGFDERYSYMGGMFGAGIYFAEHSSKSNQYVYGIGGSGCTKHKDRSCYECVRHLLLCRVALGKCFAHTTSNKMAHSPPGHHSVMGRPCIGGLNYPEYVIYRGEQVYLFSFQYRFG
ncbi:unnamed protein product [Toxocara canis]|uniref:Poly [ADP-ribose] polymerase n=1 Tax=Toxocara canis TaxID=6265 RepID=A0A183UP75_TOXCA|nr:unnamed protein product [Toxocara canis]